MKKFLHPKYLPVLVPIASALALLLRIWSLGGGPDKDGLYASAPLPWALLWIVTFFTMAGIVILGNWLKNPGKYLDNFPRSPLGATGCVAAALGVLYSSLTTLFAGGDLLATLTGLLGLISGGALLLTALSRFRGTKPHFLMHALPCLFFALRVFDCCKHWSNMTQTGAFLFQFLGSICVMLAAYQLCCFDVNLGNRKASLFWSLSAVYFCILALPMGEEPIFYTAMVLWLMTNLCSVRPLKVAQPQEPAAVPAETAEPTDVPVEQPSEAPAEEPEQASASYDELTNWLEKEI